MLALSAVVISIREAHIIYSFKKSLKEYITRYSGKKLEKGS